MLFSKNWLQDYIKEDLPSANNLAEQLGLHSFEVEGIETKGKDYILDIDVLPNRAHDALSYFGMAREISTVLDVAFQPPAMKVEPKGANTSEHLTLTVADPTIVRRATKRLVTNIKVGPSPEWLVEKLEVMGQHSINNVVDITNFVMYEFGQPVHAFDFDKLSKDSEGKVNIQIRRAEKGEKITLLDENEYELDSEMLVIADDQEVLDIAGVKGGIATGIDENTTQIVLSICNFDATNIRKTSKALGLRTDASLRFEKDISPDLAGLAMARLSYLISEIAGGDISEDLLDVYPEVAQVHKTEVHLDHINKLLGTDISEEDMKDILRRLKFDYKKEGKEYTISAPFYRLDLRIEEDFIEEIGRVYGYENIPEEEPFSGHGSVMINKEFYWINKIRDILVSEGFSEVYNYTFVNSGDIELENAIAEDKRFLRNGLTVGLERSINLGNKNAPLLGVDRVKVFEIGTVFSKKEEFVELVVSENVLDILSKELGIKVKDNPVNITDLLEELPELKNYNDLTQLDFGDMKFNPISQYPFVLRDIAVWVPNEVEGLKVLKVIKEEAEILLVQDQMFDRYEKDNRTSYAFRLVFQSQEKTLTDDEVNKIMEKITAAMHTHDGWEVR